MIDAPKGVKDMYDEEKNIVTETQGSDPQISGQLPEVKWGQSPQSEAAQPPLPLRPPEETEAIQPPLPIQPSEKVQGEASEVVEIVLPEPEAIQPVSPVQRSETAQEDTPEPETLQPALPILPPEPIEEAVLPIPSAMVRAAEVAPAQAKQRPRKIRRRRRSTSARLIVLTLAVILAIMTVSWFASFDITVERSARGLELHFSPRMRETPPREAPRRDPEPPRVFDGYETYPYTPPQMEDDMRDHFDPAPAVVLGDGTTLELHPRPAGGVDAQLSFQEIYVKLSPSVVLVEVTFRGGFGGFGHGSGSGVVMTENGYIITNAHVVEGAQQIRVVLESGEGFIAALVGEDVNSDIAVLKIDAQGLIPAVFGDSDLLQIGEEVAVIGNPLGQLHSMSNGIISALNREIVYDGITMRLIQTNAAINEGNSGGPLINRYGQVVGITNMKLVGWFSSVEGMGFAIPTTTVKPVVDAIIAHGYVPGRPGIGIVIRTVDNREAAADGIAPGIYVQSVVPNSDAAAQGIREGDRIAAFDGREVSTALELRDQIQRFEAGDTVRITIERDGRMIDLNIMLMDSALLDS